jgi:hypothetical protein
MIPSSGAPSVLVSLNLFLSEAIIGAQTYPKLFSNNRSKPKMDGRNCDASRSKSASGLSIPQFHVEIDFVLCERAKKNRCRNTKQELPMQLVDIGPTLVSRRFEVAKYRFDIFVTTRK